MLDLMAGRVSSPVFVGRPDELVALSIATERVSAGETVTLLVAGEAGVGKTRLTGEAARIAREHGFRVLRGECVNVGGSSLPYGPFVEAFRGLIAELDPSDLAAIAGPAAPDLARLVPGFGSEEATAPRQLEWVQARLFEALLGLLSRLAERSPVLLIIEDLHWADSATREALVFLVRALRTAPVQLLGTYRSDELHRRHPLLPWLAELERGGRVERLALARLARPEIAAMLTGIIGHEPRSEVVDEVFLRSDGNPFFAEELLAAGSSERAGQPLTPTLREVLLAHVARVPDVASTVLRVAAVAGRRVEHDLLAAVAGLPDVRLNAALLAAVEGHLLIVEAEGGVERFAFRHALVQEVVYDDLLPGERRSLHRAFAEALDRQVAETGASEAGRLAELAHHWAAAREDRRAFETSLRAAEAAMSSLAFAAALLEYERALELWDGLEGATDIADFDRIELFRRAGRAAYMAAEDRRAVAHRREAVAASDPIADPARAGLLREELGRALWVFGDSPAALEMYRAAVATMPVEPPSAARARALGGLAQILMLIDRYHESIALSEEAIAMARAVGASAEEGHALDTRGRSRSLLGDCAGGLADLREGLRIALDLRQADDIGRGIVNLTDELHDCGQIDDAVQEVALGIRIADEYGIGHMYGYYIRLNGVNAAYALGRWEEARRLLEEALARGPSGLGAEIYRLANTLPFLVGQGSFETADIGIARGAALLDSNPGAQFIGPVHAAASERALWRHAPQDALQSAVAGLVLLADTEDRLHRI